MSIIISIDFEENSFADFTSTVIDGGDLSVTTAAKMGYSNYGMSCLIDDQTDIYGIKDIGTANTSGTIRVRLYVDPNSFTANDWKLWSPLRIYSGSYLSIGRLYVSRTTGIGGYGIMAIAYDDSGSAHTTDIYTITDEPHFIEIQITKSSGSNDGTSSLWIDDTLKQTISAIDNDTRFADFRYLWAGAMSNDVSVAGTVYIDEIIVNDDGSYIGPVKRTGTLSSTLNDITLTANGTVKNNVGTAFIQLSNLLLFAAGTRRVKYESRFQYVISNEVRTYKVNLADD